MFINPQIQARGVYIFITGMFNVHNKSTRGGYIFITGMFNVQQVSGISPQVCSLNLIQDAGVDGDAGVDFQKFCG